MSDPPDPPAHVPVMADRVLALLTPAVSDRPAVLVDATVGLGGHAALLLAAHRNLHLVGLDRDPAALAASADRLRDYMARTTLVHAVYDQLPDVLRRLGISTVDALLFDLGVSSMQLDDAARGFAYARDVPLDMRMDPDQPRTAADVVNTYPVPELTRVLREYGEERFAARIAAAIARERARTPLTGTGRLADVVRSAVPAATRRTGGHPAKRTFQALRIEVNDELGALSRALPAGIGALRVGGRVVVLSYHSLEDRIVKRRLQEEARVRVPAGLPVIPDQARPQLRLLTRGAETPDPAEQERNPRSRSARLRAAERIREAA